MIFIDSNIPMYLIGGPHPHKIDAQRLLEMQIVAGHRLVTDAEVFQEILHRYVAIDRRDAIQPAFDALLGIVDQVYPVELDDTIRARDILQGNILLSARDALHVAVMHRHAVSRILSFDRGFSDLPGIERLF